MVEEARKMVKHRLDLYIGMNENLTQELKATHYKFSRFLEGARIRSGMNKASVVVAKFFVGMQMEDPKVPARVDVVSQTKGIDRRCTIP